MKNVKFLPWVGKNYQKGINGKRIMALGESHYCGSISQATSDITIRVIEDYIDPNSPFDHYKNTFIKFERALAGKNLSKEEKIDVWNSIIFYNYVQVPMTGPRKAPTDDDFDKSADAFFEVLETYKPDIVLVWGERLYDKLPYKGNKIGEIEMSDKVKLEIWGYYLLDGSVVKVIRITHPSAGFSPEYWHEAITKIIND